MRIGEVLTITEYIKREDAIDTVLDVYYNTPDIDLSGGRLEAAILNIPAADVAPVRHGRWRWITYDANPKIGNWHCTYCNRIPKSFQKEAFCPNCGAKMDKEEP